MDNSLVLTSNLLGLNNNNSINLANKDERMKMLQLIENDSFLPHFHEKVVGSNKQILKSFSDLELIYYFVHSPKHARDILYMLSKNFNDDVKSKQQKSRTAGTIREYTRELLIFYSHIKDYAYHFDFVSTESLFKQLENNHIENYHKWLIAEGNEGKPYSLATLARKTTILKSFFKWLYINEVISKPVHEAFYSVNIKDSERVNRDLHYHEVKQILDYYKNHVIYHAILSVLATTGARVQEICTAKWKDMRYDSEGRGYWLNILGKGGKRRDILIFHNVFERIQAFRARRGLKTSLDTADNSYVFQTNLGNPYRYKYMSNLVTRIISDTNLAFVKTKTNGKISGHFFRHFFAIESYKNGSPLRYIQQTLGHTKVETTLIYLEKVMAEDNHVGLSWNQEKF